MTLAKCNICGNDQFGPGPGGRMSSTGTSPRCTRCNSLERHRSYREVALKLKGAALLGERAIQFSPERSFDRSWFKHYEVSIYEEENSLDIQKIARPSNEYDLVVCNHVLEHVKYDNAALHELVRIAKPTGFVFLAVPAPMQNRATRDWGYPKKEDHGHYRIYGDDFTTFVMESLYYCSVRYVDQPDPVTRMPERIYLLAKDEGVAEKLGSALR